MGKHIRSAILAIALGSTLLFAGCIATQKHVNEASARNSAATVRQSKELEVLTQQMEDLEYRLDEQQQQLENLRTLLSRVDSKVETTNKDSFARLSQQIAAVQKQQNERDQQLRRDLNTKIQEINRALSSIGSSAARSSAGPSGGYERGFNHTVAAGESLWKIANTYKKYNVTTEAIKRANNMTSDTIKPGDVLFIPVTQ